MADYYSGNGAGGDANGYTQGPGPGRDDDKKLFVGGLGWQTTSDEVQEYFGQYGEVTNVNLKLDSETGRSRGFAFVTFSTSDPVQQVLSTTNHTLNGRKIEPKLIKTRQTKLFVGGLKPDMSDDDIRGHFESFGKIAQLDLPMDKVKNQRKGFCFITYENENDVRTLIKTGKTSICGVEVGVKKAMPKEQHQAAGGGGGYGSGGGGYGGGGYGGGGGGYGGGGYGGGGGYDDGYGGGYGAGGGYDDGYGAGGGYEDYSSGYGGGYEDAGYGAGGYGGGPTGGYKPRGAPRGAARGAGAGGVMRPAGRGMRGGARGRARPQPY